MNREEYLTTQNGRSIYNNIIPYNRRNKLSRQITVSYLNNYYLRQKLTILWIVSEILSSTVRFVSRTIRQ